MELYIILFIASFSLTYFVKNYSMNKNFVDTPNDRSSHTRITPHGGGVAIAITWFSGISYLYYEDNIDRSLYYALMAGLIIAVVSYLDDLYELTPKLRLLVQASVSLLGLYFLGGLSEIYLFYGSIENQIITTIFALLMIVWSINLYNFLDGIDGYAGSEAVFLAIAGFLLFGGFHFLVLGVSVLGFLVWNWHKAKIFMGDVGSTLLGYNVAIFTVYYSNIEGSNLWIWMVLFSLFWFDATLTLFRRYKNKEQLSVAHKKHGYQRLTQSGLKHDRVVFLGTLLNIILLALIYLISNLLVVFFISLLLLYFSIRYIDSKKDFFDT